MTRLLASWLMGGLLWNCRVVRAEVLRGVVKSKMKADWIEFFDLLPEVPTDTRLWREVSELAWKLDREGRVLLLTDIAIACCALREIALLISTDKHFSRCQDCNCGRICRLGDEVERCFTTEEEEWAVDR